MEWLVARKAVGAVDHQKEQSGGATKGESDITNRHLLASFFRRGGQAPISQGTKGVWLLGAQSQGFTQTAIAYSSGQGIPRQSPDFTGNGASSTTGYDGTGAQESLLGGRRFPEDKMKGPDICLLLGTGGRKVRKENDWTATKALPSRAGQGSMGKAVQIAKSKGFDRVVKAFKGKFFAKSALASRMCRRNEVLKLARTVADGRSVLPLAKSTVEGVAAALKEAQMKSGAQYLNELKLLHIEAGYEMEAWLKRCFDLCKKSLERNKGPTKRAAEVRVDSEATKKRGKMVSKKGTPQHIGLCFLWAAIWMLREIEVRNMKVRDVLINEEEKWAAIKIPISKCDQQGEGVRRTLRCCGSTPCQPVCPVSLAKTAVTCAKAKSLTLGLPLFTDHEGLYVNKRGVISGWKTTFGKQVSGHSARRSGAMYYVRRGLAIQELAFLGRWKSSVVLTYAEEALQETPIGLNQAPGSVAGDKAKDINGEVVKARPRDTGKTVGQPRKGIRQAQGFVGGHQGQRMAFKAKTLGDQSIVELTHQRMVHSLWMDVRSAVS
eukprot:s3307_g3.t1